MQTTANFTAEFQVAALSWTLSVSLETRVGECMSDKAFPRSRILLILDGYDGDEAEGAVSDRWINR
jgi:hypothetical protein